MQDNEQQTSLETGETSVSSSTQEQKPSGKTFTQDEVNAIVRDRLSRQKSVDDKPKPSEKELELSARENKLECREFISKSNYPVQLLDVLDTTNFEQFQEMTKKLFNAFPQLLETTTAKPATTGVQSNGYSIKKAEKIANAFKPQL